jgi:DtxR family Mn-dependent transcriptional regulator
MTEQHTPPQSESVENFLKAVYILQQQSERVSTNTLSETLNISAPSVTDMAQRMVAAGLVDYQKYRGVVLTPAGEEIALRIIRRHRLIELYLVEELGYALAEVHDEAERLEHAVSERFVEAIASRLGHPDFDPHGDPIPTREGMVIALDQVPLSELALGTPAQVARLKATSPEMLQHILDRGFALDSQVEVLDRDPFDGPVTALLENKTRVVVGYQVAECIYVGIAAEQVETQRLGGSQEYEHGDE